VYGFTQKERDGESGLNYFEARYHDGLLGRFASADPVIQTKPQHLNSYTYSLNRPLSYVDPSGCTAAEIADVADQWINVGAESFKVGDTSEANFWNDVIVDSGRDFAKLMVDTLRCGEGFARAQITAENGAYGTAALEVLGDIGRGASIASGAGAVIGKAGSLLKAPKTGVETVQRAMSRAELESIQGSGVLSRGGRAGDHFVSDAVNSTVNRARQRLALPGSPEVRVTLEVPSNVFTTPSRVQPKFNMPGGGMERTAPGNLDIPATVLDVLDYTR
jgi:RHS repeat-associated protein